VSSRRIGPRSSVLALAVSVSTRRVVVGGRELPGLYRFDSKEDSEGDHENRMISSTNSYF
jgi:hypothetical protein